MHMIKAENIHKKYGQVEVLKGVDLSVKAGEIVSIMGASGAGKSTLLQIIGTLERPDQGHITIGGTGLTQLGDHALSAFRNKNIGFVFQFHHLLPEFTALENVFLPALIAGTEKKLAKEKAIELLAFLNLAHRQEHKPGALSGGEQQRVAIARALINQPDVILADEPTGNLDSQNSSEIHKLILNLRDTYQQTFLIVTHNKELAELADRSVLMKDGLIISA